MAYDPICGKKVQPVRETPAEDYKQRTYYFCCESCRQEFRRAAERVKLHDAARGGALFAPGKVHWGFA